MPRGAALTVSRAGLPGKRPHPLPATIRLNERPKRLRVFTSASLNRRSDYLPFVSDLQTDRARSKREGRDAMKQAIGACVERLHRKASIEQNGGGRRITGDFGGEHKLSAARVSQ